MIVDQLQASLVTFISLAPYDNEGKLVKAVHEGDIVEIVDPETYATCQFLIGEDVTNAQAMQVTYMSGSDTYWWVTTQVIYIYPQNKIETVTQEYVDAGDKASKDYADTLVEGLASLICRPERRCAARTDHD